MVLPFFFSFFYARAKRVQQKMVAFSPQMCVAERIEEAKLQWKKEKLNNIGVLQKRLLVSEKLSLFPAARQLSFSSARYNT